MCLMSDEPKPRPPVRDEEQHVDRSVLIGMGGRWVTDWALRLAIILIAGWALSRLARRRRDAAQITED